MVKDGEEQCALNAEPGDTPASANTVPNENAEMSLDTHDLGDEFEADWSNTNDYGQQDGKSDVLADDLPAPDALPNSNALHERQAPRHDGLKNDYTRVIHTNGIHQIGLVTCGCLGSNNIHADLVYSKLIPASFSIYKTIFTIDVLDDFRLSNLECKASAYQYFQKLRRRTAPTAPASTSNFYQELLRMSRLWRWLKKKKWAGHGHMSVGSKEPSPILANFCPACPQPGINLPDDWQRDPLR